MIALLCFALAILASPFSSKSRLEAENAALRHQVVMLRRMVHRRVRLTNSDRLFFIQLYRWFPSVLKVIMIIRPEISSVGIGPAFVGTGVGSRARLEGGRFISYSEWETEADIERYTNSAAHKQIVSHTRSVKGASAVVKLYDLVN